MTDQELTDLLEQARADNTISQVTGMLLYRAGKFLQVLEGDEAVVEALYKKIEPDSRHYDLQVLLTGQRAKRQFPDWSMGFANLSGLAGHDPHGFSSFFRDGFDVEAMRLHPQRAYRLLLRFREDSATDESE